MDLGLSGRVALVVGGHGYLGTAIAARLRAEGATVVSGSRHPGPDGIVVDGSDDASVRSAIDGILAEHGRLDALIVTAAPAAQTLDPSKSADPDSVLAAIDGKAMTFLRLANAVLPRMTEAGYGRIVGISGQNAYMTGSIAGVTRNAALIIAAKSLADSVAGSGVTVTTVSPGGISDDPSAEVATGSGGESSPEQIAALVAFLASPLSAAVSGQDIAAGHRVRGVLI